MFNMRDMFNVWESMLKKLVAKNLTNGVLEPEEMADLLGEQKDAIITKLSIQRKSATHTDVVIECNDGQLHAHKWVLTAKNQYFEAMFQCPMLESKTNKIVFNRSSAAIEVILAFVYGESQPARLLDNPKLLLELIETSHMLQITKLFKFCWKSLVHTMNSTNLLEIWDLATKFEERKTLTRILKFVRAKWWSMPKKILRKFTEPVPLESVCALLEGDVLDDYLASFKLNITHLVVDDFSGVAKRVVYHTRIKSWDAALENLQLNQRHCTNWQAISSVLGEVFYYGIGESKQIVVFDLFRGKYHFGPRSSNVVVSGILDDYTIYFRELNVCFVVFNPIFKEWKKLCIDMKECGQTVLVSNGKIYFDSNSNSNSIRVYNMAAGTWREVLKPATELVNVRCKCLSTSCAGKLYFMNEKKSLFVWSERSGSWCEKVIPLVGDRVAVVANCERDLIVFRESGDGSSLWLYYVLCERWVKLPLTSLDICQNSWVDVSYAY